MAKFVKNLILQNQTDNINIMKQTDPIYQWMALSTYYLTRTKNNIKYCGFPQLLHIFIKLTNKGRKGRALNR